MQPPYPDPMPHGMDFENLRIPPHSIEAESSLLGALMLDNEAWDQVRFHAGYRDQSSLSPITPQ
jgi:replicative DNA helicase